MMSHDLYCDEQHSDRQQCNDALAPADVRASAQAESDAAAVAEPAAAVEPEPEDEPASPAVHDAVAAADVPEPTVYVSREWDRTTSAVEAIGLDDDGFAVEKDAPGGGTGRRVVLALVAIAVVLVTVRGVRGRRGERV
jgi:hypothetical protein